MVSLWRLFGTPLKSNYFRFMLLCFRSISGVDAALGGCGEEFNASVTCTDRN